MNRSAIRLITTAVGLNMIVFGISQITRPAGWRHYLPQSFAQLLPMSRDTALRIHGLGNISLGLWFASGRGQKVSTPIVAGWWAFVLPLCGRQDWRAGMRDVSILGAILAVGSQQTKHQ